MIISVHIRKCAGTTFRISLQNYFRTRLLLDYGDEIGSTWPNSKMKREASLLAAKNNADNILNRHDIIHGHFYRDKYDFLETDKRYITFLRDPVSRVLSNYFYLKRNLERKNKDALIVNKLGFSLEEFMQHPNNRNLQSQYLRSTSLNDFEFVGIVEEYAQSLERLNFKLGINLELGASENVNEKSSLDYDVSTSLISKIKNCNLIDLRLYDEAINLIM